MKSTKETPNSSIDWRKVQLVASKDQSKILLTTGIHHDDFFDAVVVYDLPETVGHVSANWIKSSFIPFQGTITLEND